MAIKTFKHRDLEERDKEVNEFLKTVNNFATQTNVVHVGGDYNTTIVIITTVFYKE